MQGNPILNQLNKSRNNNLQIQPYKKMLKQIQSSPNPQLALQNMLMQNPNVSRITEMLKANNGSLQQIAEMLAKQRGVDLNALIQELQS